MNLGPNRGSSAVVIAIIVTTLLLIIGVVAIRRPRDKTPVVPQASQQGDSHAFYIAQTALDRSIKTLVANPSWRDGFQNVPFDNGVYNVRVYDANNQELPEGRIPPNYVRIIATSEIDGVRKEVEAVWVNAMSAFEYTMSAGNSIEIGHDGDGESTFPARLHNNAWQNGDVQIHDGVTVFGDITSVGDIQVGTQKARDSAAVFGDVRGARIQISDASRIHAFENLNERDHGIDLNNDGDVRDIGVGRSQTVVAGATEIRSHDHRVKSGETDRRIADATLAVSVGKQGVGPIVDPRPDFIAYFELVTGSSSYPQTRDHVSVPILGDGDGHYFASADAFFDWLGFQNSTSALCWRCAGEGHIDPRNTTVCPACGATGRTEAKRIIGVFYIDAPELDLGELEDNLIVHGTFVVAEGNPYQWPEKHIEVPGETSTIGHFPERGRFVLKGQNRMHVTIAYRADSEGGAYIARNKTIFSGEEAQTLSILAPRNEQAMRDFPAIVAAQSIEIEPRRAGFAYHPGDIGDEKLTILQGVIYAETSIRIHGRGGWSGEALVFDETLNRQSDETIDEPILNIDLNGDDDIFDRVELSSISTVPVVPVTHDRYNVDINNDGTLQAVTIGGDYQQFFASSGHRDPILVYHEGLWLGRALHACEQVMVVDDPGIRASGIPFGFEVTFGSSTYQGLVSWWERRSP